MLNRIRKNSAYLLILTLSNYFVGLLAFPYLSRVLSVENFGLVVFAMMYTLVFQSIVEYGFTISGTARISLCRDDKTAVFQVVTDVMIAKFILIVISSVAFIVSSFFVEIVRNNLLFMTIFFVSSITSALVPDFFFRGTENMRTIASRAFLSRMLSIAIIIVAVNDDGNRLMIPISFFLGNAGSVAWSFFSMRKLGFKYSSSSKLVIVDYIKTGFLFFLSRVSATANQAAGAVALSFLFSGTSHDLGIYTAAWRVASAGEMLLTPFTDSLYPHMIKERDYRLFWRVYVRGVLIWFVCCSIVFTVAEPLCEILLGDNYADSGNVLRILLIGTFMAYSSIMFGYNALSPIGLERYANISLISSVILNLVLLSTLMFTGFANIWTVSIVIASTNVFLFAFRASVFYRYRYKITATI